MSKGKQQYVKGVTPKGVAKFPKLTTPDTKFKPEGEYTTKLVIEAEEAAPLIAKIDAEAKKEWDRTVKKMVEDGKAKTPELAAKKLKWADKCYRPEEDDDGNETGNVVFTLKSKASYTKDEVVHKLNPPALFDAKGKPLAKGVDVWGGSVIKCSYEMMPFSTAIGVGVSLRLQAVQVLELRTRGSRDAAGYGFGEEDGFAQGDDESSEGDDSSAEGDGSDDSGAASNPDF